MIIVGFFLETKVNPYLRVALNLELLHFTLTNIN
jgi:hypothetical protein